jgi:hypothetical protein
MSSVAFLTSSRTFFDLYRRGEVSRDDIDDFIDAWHGTADLNAAPLPLHDYLGMSRDEYEIWVRDPGALPTIALERQNPRRVQV